MTTSQKNQNKGTLLSSEEFSDMLKDVLETGEYVVSDGNGKRVKLIPKPTGLDSQTSINLTAGKWLSIMGAIVLLTWRFFALLHGIQDSVEDVEITVNEVKQLAQENRKTLKTLPVDLGEDRFFGLTFLATEELKSSRSEEYKRIAVTLDDLDRIQARDKIRNEGALRKGS